MKSKQINVNKNQNESDIFNLKSEKSLTSDRYKKINKAEEYEKNVDKALNVLI